MMISSANLRYSLNRYLGKPGLIGIALLVLAGILAWLLMPQTGERLVRLENELQATKSDTSKNKQRQLAAPSTVLQLRNFFDWLPSASSNAADIKVLFAAAKEAQIDLIKADYQIVSDPNARLIRYQIILPVKERYPTIRKFSSLVLTKLPHLALDEFVVTRPQAASSVIEAQLQFTLFYRLQ
jgi:hypothetical protein